MGAEAGAGPARREEGFGRRPWSWQRPDPSSVIATPTGPHSCWGRRADPQEAQRPVPHGGGSHPFLRRATPALLGSRPHVSPASAIVTPPPRLRPPAPLSQGHLSLQRTHRLIQDHLPSQDGNSAQLQSLLPCERTGPRVPGVRTWTSWPGRGASLCCPQRTGSGGTHGPGIQPRRSCRRLRAQGARLSLCLQPVPSSRPGLCSTCGLQVPFPGEPEGWGTQGQSFPAALRAVVACPTARAKCP